MNGFLTIVNDKPIVVGEKNKFDPDTQEKARLVSKIVKIEKILKECDSSELEQKVKTMSENMTVDQLTDYAEKC